MTGRSVEYLLVDGGADVGARDEGPAKGLALLRGDLAVEVEADAAVERDLVETVRVALLHHELNQSRSAISMWKRGTEGVERTVGGAVPAWTTASWRGRPFAASEWSAGALAWDVLAVVPRTMLNSRFWML